MDCILMMALRYALYTESITNINVVSDKILEEWDTLHNLSKTTIKQDIEEYLSKNNAPIEPWISILSR